MVIGDGGVDYLVEIKDYAGEGYQPLIHYGGWRVAILRWGESSPPEKIRFMERHTQTDEVFVLLHGQATLILGGNTARVEGLHHQKLEECRLYNVKRNVWHTVMMSSDVSILIVEESNTGDENTEFCELSGDLRKEIMRLA